MYRKGFVLVYFVLSNLFGLNCLGQELFFEKISGQDIDPSTSIHGIAKDSIGYIWFGSWNGAYRYDGKTFNYYYHNSADSKSLPNNRIRNIVSDNKLGLWFLTFDHKYARFNYQLNTFSIVDSKGVPKVILSKLNCNSNELNKDRVVNGKRYYLSSHQLTSKNIDSGKEFHYVADISQPGSLLDDYITTYFIDDENIIWLGTRGGDIYKANPNRNPFELHYSYISKNGKTKLASVRAILKVRNEIWLGTDEGVLIYNSQGINYNHPFYRSNSKIDQVRTLFQDNKGGIWIGGVNGLEYYNPNTNQIKLIINKELNPRLQTWSVFAIEAFGNDMLWVGLYNGIARINLSNQAVVFYDLAKEISNHSVMDILIVDKNKLLLATEGNGLIQLTINNKGEVFNDTSFNSFRSGSAIKKKISQSIIYALHKDKNGAVWVGTSEGLYKIKLNSNPTQAENIQLQSEIPNTYISAITDDNEGNIWIAHKEGISRINANSAEISNYQKKDQYSSWRFLERALYKDVENNIIYFGAKNGYVTFNPKDIKTISKSNRLILRSLYVSSQEVIPMDTIWGRPILFKILSQTKSIQLDYENRSFTIELASFNYRDSRKEVYEYKLEGYEDNWIKTTNNKISFNKVPPGNYTFKVRLVSNSGNVPVTQLNIDVSAPWYGSWWFRTLFLLMVVAGIYWVFKEMLYRDRLKNEIKQERLNTERQEALTREKIEFFTNISHDLKTPLTLIVDPLKRLQANKVPAEDKELYFSMIDRNIKNLTKLIYQILDFRKSETGKLKLNASSRNFNAFAKECHATFQFIAEKRNIKFELHLDEELTYCYLDFEKTEQIIINVLSNAFQYTPDGGKISFSIGLNEEKSSIKIVVEDNGVGIEASELKKIFEPFNTVGASPFYGYSSGIGLSLARNLIAFLNGSISIESELNKGTKLLIDLPYQVAEEDSIASISAESNSLNGYKNESHEGIISTDSNNSKPTLLIVEDNPDVQIYLKKELSKDYFLIQEYDGKKGLEAAIKHIPDIIVSDIMMPEMEGTLLGKKLKSNENTSHIPLIFLTAKGSDNDQIEGYNLGAEAYVMKPFNVDVLNAQIKSVLENRMILQNRLAGIKEINQLQQEVPDLDNQFLEKVIEKITRHIEETDFNSEELAKVLGISQRQLYRKLKGISGNTVHEFIIKVKMNEAEKLLKNSDLSVSQIAYKVGFSEPSNFSRTFSKYFGCSPSQYGK
ncbi:hybrid sensor histidine kinase/response regulator transcription factor [Flavobacterium aquiphilum]|uniref:hybrid sensor histidine kinase/response regulator transcription factor n=1 Tax=Flavobacterium aquiphilum TaxID=3003261 RepID=UPI00248106F5|nr:hybrid sensor histidine kinase/response regulator transcription factor [Flavobacterium aquiphilum]